MHARSYPVVMVWSYPVLLLLRIITLFFIQQSGHPLLYPPIHHLIHCSYTPPYHTLTFPNLNPTLSLTLSLFNNGVLSVWCVLAKHSELCRILTDISFDEAVPVYSSPDLTSIQAKSNKWQKAGRNMKHIKKPCKSLLTLTQENKCTYSNISLPWHN
jgi:hypothetical protein